MKAQITIILYLIAIALGSIVAEHDEDNRVEQIFRDE